MCITRCIAHGGFLILRFSIARGVVKKCEVTDSRDSRHTDCLGSAE